MLNFFIYTLTSTIVGFLLGTISEKNVEFDNKEMLQPIEISVEDFGANGKDSSDDWTAFQKAIDFLANKGGGKLFVPSGKYIINNKSIIIWGKNIQLIGESKSNTIIEKRGVAGWWGDVIAITGKVDGGKYFGSFGKTDYNRFIIYKGRNETTQNVTISNLTIVTNSNNISNRANNLGITNADNVTISNSNFYNAPQTNVAIINVANKTKNGRIALNNCVFSGSGAHNVRVISFNEGSITGNRVSITNSSFQNVKRRDSNFKEINNKSVHLWYRAGVGGNDISLTVNNCRFDSTGIIAGTGNINGFSMLNSNINSFVSLSGSKRFREGTVRIENNTFHQKGNNPLISIDGIARSSISGNHHSTGAKVANSQVIIK